MLILTTEKFNELHLAKDQAVPLVRGMLFTFCGSLT